MRRAETIIENSLKRCLTCGELKSFSDFHKHKGHFLGLASQCKECKGEKDREYSKRNRTKITQRHKEWALNNRDKININSRRYWRKNKDKHQVLIRNRRAKLGKAEGKFTHQEWLELKKKHKYRCAICKKTEPFKQYRKFLTVDHIVPVSKGGSNYITNIQPLCFVCNSVKKDKE